jgi:regulator of replication initiation timing
MTRNELDIADFAKLSCGMHLTSMTTQSRQKEQKEWKTQRTDIYHHGFLICRDVFKSLHVISQ